MFQQKQNWMNERAFHPCLSAQAYKIIIDSLNTVANLSYGTLDALSVAISVIKDALVLGNAEGLKIFLFDISSAVKSLKNSNDSLE